MNTIRILQKTYEMLYVLSKPVNKYLKKRLPEISTNWKKDCIEDVLKVELKDGSSRYEEKSINQLDIYYLLKILLTNKNWNRLKEKFPMDPLYTTDNKTFLTEIKNLRNTVAHPTIKDYTNADFNNWKNKIERAAELFNSDLGTLLHDLHFQEKQKLLLLIEKKVISPALNCTTLDRKTKSKVKNTEYRLEIQETAEGIIDFFEDALRATGGKKIRDTLHKNNLTAFEDISDEIFKLYYGKNYLK